MPDPIKDKDIQEGELNTPSQWPEVSLWLSSLINSKQKVADALLVDVESNNFAIHRIATLFGISMMWSKTFEKFANYFGSEDRAQEILNLIDDTKKVDETRAIRMADTLFDSMASNLRMTGIKEIINWIPTSKGDFHDKLSKDDWDALVSELKNPDSVFLSDSEMVKLDKTPRTADATERPARFDVASLWSGRSGIVKTKGDFQKSINYHKEKNIKD